MTSKFESAARMALDALETDEQWGFVAKRVLERRIAAITALREALADVDTVNTSPECVDKTTNNRHEPVAWMRLNNKGECEAIEYIRNFDEHLYLPPSCQWLYTIPVQYENTEPKVIAYIVARPDSISRKLVWVENMDAYRLDGDIVTPLYAAPVQQVDLTDDEIYKLVKQVRFDGMTDRTFQFARAVIAADREKNK